jgi:Fe-S oxidoreductase/nitrate reductase gamma subunit
MMLLAAEKSRPIMWDLSLGMTVVWYACVAISIAVFLYGIARPFARYRGASKQGLPPLRAVPGRLLAGTLAVFSHRAIARRSKRVGWAHRGIFFGWCVLAIGTVIVALDHDLLGPLFGVHILHGNFYLAFKAALNALGAALIAGLLAMMLRRAVLRPARLDYARPDREPGEFEEQRRRYRTGDWVFVVSLLAIAITGFILEGVRMAMEDPGYGVWQFGGWIVAQPLEGLSAATLGDVRHGLWWFHGLLALTFVAAIPYTKATHMISSWLSTALRDPDAKCRLRPEQDEGESAGYGRVADLPALHLLQLDACTKCGRCHEVCPATATGRPLSPRDVVLELHERVDAAYAEAGVDGLLGQLLSGRAPAAAEASLIGAGAVRPETAWACMQCNACVEVCPVGIEQAPIIAGLRRSLVEEGELDPGLQSTLRLIHKSGNSFGENRRRRGRWTEELDFEVKDARVEPVDLLWFVGDYASFDPRSQRITRTLARVLHGAGVDFGILYDGERNSGNDVRRVGEEGLFELLAESNIATLSECEFSRILTTDPHSLNTLRNEYPDLGGEWTVLHHTELLLELVESGRLEISQPLGERVTYHDPCYLGRVNGGFDAPRDLLSRLGCELIEMPRNRERSFCCGAGGGCIWIGDSPQTERPSENRIREALELERIESFVVSCPKDVTMYEDAIKTTGNADRLVLREITELVQAACAPGLAATPA